MSAVPDVTVVPVSPSSVVTEHFGGASWDLDWESVEPQSLRMDDAAHATANFAFFDG